MRKIKNVHNKSRSSFWAIGLLILLSIFLNNAVLIIAGSIKKCFKKCLKILKTYTFKNKVEPTVQQPETIASLSEQLKRLTLTVQNHTAQLEDLGKVLRQQQQQQQQTTSGTAASTAQIVTISSQTTNNSRPQDDLSAKLPPLPECNLNSTPPTATESTAANDAESKKYPLI